MLAATSHRIDRIGRAASRRFMVGWVTLAAILSATSISAQTPAKAFLAINVRDAGVSAAWYARTFQLQLVNRYDRPGFDQRILASDRLVVELIQLKPLPAKAPQKHLGLTKAGVVVAEIDADIARWKSQGVRFFGGGRLIYDKALGLHTTLLLDPDENLIQVFGVSGAVRR
jgi:hypothetical protein